MFQIWIFPVETIRYFYPEWDFVLQTFCWVVSWWWMQSEGIGRSLSCADFPNWPAFFFFSVFWWEEPSCQHILLSCRECRSSQIWSALSRLQKDSRNACLWDLLSDWSLQFFLSDSRSAALFSQTFCWAGPDAADGILLYYLDTHSCRFP